MARHDKPRLVGINHVALEVGDVTAALDFYGSIFTFELRGSHRDDENRVMMAFLDMGDQFLAISEGRNHNQDDKRHFGLVVDDREKVRERALAAGATILDGSFCDFLDPWGNRIQVVAYRDVQFTKSDSVLRALAVSPEKTQKALSQLREKGIRD
jgi:catechol 2,3-dioxygenase-like lactoylglutathione lyase family enzyme